MQVQACGVCHTDLHYREGAINDDFPFLLGHEAAGIVESVGDDVDGVAPGDFVILNWRAVCGNCRACKRGRPWYCFATHNATQKMTLADGTPLSPALGIGAFAEQTLVAAGQATKVDPRARPEVAGLLGCGVMAGLGAAMYTGERRARRQHRGVRLRRRRATPRSRARASRAPTRSSASTSTSASSRGHASSARPTPSTHATPIPSKRSARSPTATAPTSASKRSVAPRCSSRRSTRATSRAPSCRWACPTRRCASSCR